MIYEFLSGWIQSQSDLITAIGTRFGPLENLQADFPGFPAITYSITEHDRMVSMSGLSGLAWEHFLVEVWSRDPDEAKTVAEMVKGSSQNRRLDGYKTAYNTPQFGMTVLGVFLTSVRDLDDEPQEGEASGKFRRSMEFKAFFRE